MRLSRAFCVAALLAIGAAHAATPPDTLVVAKSIDDLISLDPAEAYEASGGEVITNIYDRIVRYEADDLTHLVGGVAASWTVSQDGKTLTFTLRPGLHFWDGTPVTADDAAFSLQRVVLLDKTPAFLLAQFGWTKANVGELVTAPDPLTLKLQLAANLAPNLVLSILSSTIGSVVEKQAALAHQQAGDLGNAWLKTNAAGSGAFQLRSWHASESVIMDANPDYHLGAPALHRVIIRHIPDPSTQRLMLQNGDADIARNLTPEAATAVAADPSLKLRYVPSADTYYVALNQSDPHLANPKVVEALHWLVDYQQMANSFLKGQFQVDQAFWPKGLWASLDSNPYKLDVAHAKELLAQAGYPDGFDIQMDAAADPPWSEIAQSLQATMAQAGVRVHLRTSELKQLWTTYRARQHQMLLIEWSPDYLDPHTNAQTFVRNTDNSEHSTDRTVAWRNNWADPALSAIVDRAVAERDPDRRAALYQDLQRTVLQRGPYLIMFRSTTLIAERHAVQGFVVGPYWDLVFYRKVTK